MAIENYVSNYFYLRSSIVLSFSIAPYPVLDKRPPRLSGWLNTYPSFPYAFKVYNVNRIAKKCVNKG